MEVINSFFSNIKDKLSNPYFGTLIIVLIIHHWELIFGVFNFDKVFTLDKKLEFVQKYIVNNITWKSFLWDAVQALLYMFVGYLIVVLTRSIVMFIEFGLMPFITGKIVNKNVVRRIEYDKAVREREQYFDQYEEQRNYVRNFSKTIDEQTEQIKQKDKNLLEQTNTISETISELDSLKLELKSSENKRYNKSQQIDQFRKSIENLEEENRNYKEKIKVYENLYFDKKNSEFYSTINKFPPEIMNKVNELKNDNKWNDFLHFGHFFENGGSIDDELLSEMVERGLAFKREDREYFTPIGQIIYRYSQVFKNDFDKRRLLL